MHYLCSTKLPCFSFPCFQNELKREWLCGLWKILYQVLMKIFLTLPLHLSSEKWFLYKKWILIVFPGKNVVIPTFSFWPEFHYTHGERDSSEVLLGTTDSFLLNTCSLLQYLLCRFGISFPVKYQYTSIFSMSTSKQDDERKINTHK